MRQFALALTTILIVAGPAGAAGGPPNVFNLPSNVQDFAYAVQVSLGDGSGLAVGIRAATVPSVVGILEKQAVAVVKAAGLTVQEVFQTESDCAVAGRVVLQSRGPGAEVALGSTLTLTIGQKSGNICP